MSTPGKAPRLPSRHWHVCARGALPPVRLWPVFMALFATGLPAWATEIAAARYTDPTERYPHAVLGDAIEWGALELTLTDGSVRHFVLPRDHVFEDVAPRLADVDDDSAPEVIVVEADIARGGALAVYDETGKIAETPHIGTRFRWLSPLGAADLDGDGSIELAYVDRPHLAKTLRIWRFSQTGLEEMASLRGLTNHRIGEPDIAGGIRICGPEPEMILATANWSQLVAVRWDGGTFDTTVLGRDTTRPAFARAMSCG